MQIIKSQKEAIAGRSEEARKKQSQQYEQLYSKSQPTPAKLKKVLPGEEKRIIACLSYLKMLVLNSEKDGMHGLIPHTALDQGSVLDAVSITNAYEMMNFNGFRARFPLGPISSNLTVYQLK